MSLYDNKKSIIQKITMMARGELCALPKCQLATCFDFETCKSDGDIRNPVLHGSLAARLHDVRT